MRNRWLSLWLSLAVALSTALAPPAAWAESGRGVDVRLVIDVSGSMKENDPDNLRARGIRLMTDLLPDGTRAGLWTFGQQVTNPLVLGEVDVTWRERARTVLEGLARYEQFTDLETALSVVTDDPGPGSGVTHLIVLTDGVVDIPAVTRKAERDRASRQRILETQAPELAERDIIVHTIALSDNADTALMQQLAGQTGGLAAIARDASDLLRVFLDVLNQVVPRQQLPLEGGRFQVDDQISELSALFFHAPEAGEVTLSAPDGSRLSADAPGAASRWQHDPLYDLITLTDPAVGEWQVNGPIGAGSRILIDSSLRLESAPLPTRLYQHLPLDLTAWLVGAGESDESLTIEARLVAEGGTTDVGGANDSDDTHDSDTTHDSDGRIIASTPLVAGDDGRFHGTLEDVDQTGSARIDLLAQGEGFERLISRGVTVVSPVKAELDEAQSRIALRAVAERLTTDNTRIEARLLGESLAVEAVDHRRWRVTLPESLPEASVEVALKARVALDNETREITLSPVRLNAGAATGVAGAALDQTPVRGEPMADNAMDKTTPEVEEWSLQRLWSAAQERWPQIKAQGARLTQDPRAWVAVAALLLLWLLLTWRHRHRRRQRRRPKRDPRV